MGDGLSSNNMYKRPILASVIIGLFKILLVSQQVVVQAWLTSSRSRELIPPWTIHSHRLLLSAASTTICEAGDGSVVENSREGSLLENNDEVVRRRRRRTLRLDLDDDAVPALQRQLLIESTSNGSGDEDLSSTTKKSLVEVEGYLISKRGFGSSFCFIDLSRRGVQIPVQAMLKRQSFLREESKYFDGFMKSLVPGIRIRITGPVVPTRNPGEAVILIEQINIVGIPHNPQHVRKIIRLVACGELEADHIASACQLTEKDLLKGIQDCYKKDVNNNSNDNQHKIAARILETLREKHESDTEYPEFSSDHKHTHSLPVASADLQLPFVSKEFLKDDVSWEKEVESLSVQATLERYFHQQSIGENSTVKAISLTGFVQNRRRFQGSISTLEIVDEMIPTGDADPEKEKVPIGKQRLKCILNPTIILSNNTEQANVLGQLLAPGSKLRLWGYVFPNNKEQTTINNNNSNVPTLWIYQTTLLCSSWRPTVVQFLIEQVRVGSVVKIPEAAHALHISHQELERIVALDDLTKRQWESTEIARRLEREQADLSLHVDPKALSVLNEFEDIRASRPLTFVDYTAMADDHAVRKNKLSDFVSTAGSRYKRKKEPQLEWMTQQVQRVLQQSYPGKFDNGKEMLRVLDIGGGKGFFANFLARELLGLGYRVKILVVDVAERAIHNGRLRTERKNLSHAVEYIVADASTVDIHGYGGVDLVVALHACGALTDVALGHAVDQNAAFAICPCCFRSNPTLRVPVRNHQGCSSSSSSSKGTASKDSSVPVEEWLGVDGDKYDKLKSLAEVQGDLNLANRAIHTLCALRSFSVEQHSTTSMDVSIQTFPVAFSTRNFCLVGNHAS